MSKIYFFSDPHFGHEHVAEWRGFKSSEEHDRFVIDNWNKAITKKDVVYLLGDITMEKNNYDQLRELKGIINVVLGNHDQPQHIPDLLKVVNKIMGMRKLDGFWLTHAPMHPQELRGHFNIHGHVHGNSINDNRYFNVSAEVINYTPISFFEIKQRMGLI